MVPFFRRILGCVSVGLVCVLSQPVLADDVATPVDANQATDKANQATDKANQATDKANQATDKANQATDKANQVANAARIALDAAKQSAEADKSSQGMRDVLTAIKDSIDELRMVTDSMQQQTPIPAPAPPVAIQQQVLPTAAPEVANYLEETLKSLKDLQRTRELLNEHLQPIPAFRGDNEEQMKLMMEILKMMKETIKDQEERLEQRMDRLENKMSELTPAEKALAIVLNRAKIPNDANNRNLPTTEFYSSPGKFTSSLFITTPVGPYARGQLYVNGTAIEMKPGSVQNVELEFRASPSMCHIRLMPAYSMGMGNGQDQPYKRFLVEPGQNYLIDTSEFTSDVPSTMAQPVVAMAQ
ncbi:MAG TPA: hypothetical protein PLY87_18870 [Planctomycetaceae bacterium]|nr:hypothetical protein [Planctomycetaceae bacterium]